jgi:hypothetical protein
MGDLACGWITKTEIALLRVASLQNIMDRVSL